LKHKGNIMELAEWLAILETRHPNSIDLGLERIYAVAQRMALTPSFVIALPAGHASLPAKTTVITVAGTNGKGSTVAALEACYLAAGYRVGAYTSPHLLRYNERVRIQGTAVSDAALCESFIAVEAARGELPLSYFECGTLSALWLFNAADLDIVILEVGLGGRLDAVNIVTPTASVITTISLDHTEWLGPTREDIGFEKAGIFRTVTPAIIGEIKPPKRMLQRAQSLQCPVSQQGVHFGFVEQTRTTWSWWNQNTRIESLSQPGLPLQNMATAVQVVQQLQARHPVSESALQQAFATLTLPGRWQTIAMQPCVQIVDVAHNPESAAYLAAQLQTRAISGKTRAVVAMLVDKDIPATLKPLMAVVDAWYAAGLPAPRGADATVMMRALTDLGVSQAIIHPAVADAYRAAVADSEARDRIIIFGSFHTVAAALIVGDHSL
jgi:dihydrofolate synthase / folylpolyglutamate synthase